MPNPGMLVGARPANGAGDFLDWQAENHVFEEMAAFMFGTFSLTGSAEPEGLLAATVTDRFVETLGIAPLLGQRC